MASLQAELEGRLILGQAARGKDDQAGRSAPRAETLYLVLGLVMFVTRRVDWYARDAG